MRARSLRWVLLLLCWPAIGWAADAAVHVVELAVAPQLAPGHAPAPTVVPEPAKSRVWLHAPHRNVAWYQLTPAHDWQRSSPPVLAIGGNTRARVTVRLPPDYRPRTETVFDPGLDPTLSHHAVVYRLPSHWRADQPVYLSVGDPGQTQPIRIRVTDEQAYRIADVAHVRLSTALAAVQLSMVLVILCFWIVLRDRMYLYFVIYVSAQAVYAMAVSGELFALPVGRMLAPLGYHTGQSMAALAAAFSIWFILAFAGLRRYTPRFADWLRALRWPFLALAAIVWMPWLRPDAWLPNTVNVLLIVATLLVLAAAWLAWRNGNRQAGFFLLSWIPLLLLTVTRVGQLLAGFPLPAWLEYGFPGSMAWSAVIITVGLADRTLQVRHERDHAARMAQFDPLTGVFNRRAITERLHEAWLVASAAASPLAVLFLDIDHFKRINDSRGHAAGDTCLCEVTEAIRAELGGTDRLGRYGGEEFLIVLNGASAIVAPQIAERIVARIAALRVPVGEHLVAVTVSVGVALRDGTLGSVDAMVERADAALYRAKAQGRNRAVVYRGEGPAALPASARAG